MTRHHNWSQFKHFNVNRYLHGLTRWEKNCSVIGYSDCQVNGHVGNMLLSFAILLSIFRFTKRSAKKFGPYHYKNKMVLRVKVYIIFSESDEIKNRFSKHCKLFSVFMVLLTIGLLLFGNESTYGTSNNKTHFPIYDYTDFQCLSCGNGSIETIDEFRTETQDFYSLWATMSCGFKLVLMLLLLCGDVEQNPGPQTLEEKLDSQSLHLLKWMDQDGKKQKTKVYQDLASEWRKVADFLGLTPQQRESIEENYRMSEKCIVKVFEKWMDNKEELKRYPCTWNGLCELLNDMDRTTLSQEVINVFGSLENLGNTDLNSTLLQLIWWEDEDGMTNELKVYDELAECWRDVATRIGLPSPKITEIENKCRNERSHCCYITAVFEAWRSTKEISRYYPCTWNGLRKVMEGIKLSLSQDLKSALLANKSGFRHFKRDVDQTANSGDERVQLGTEVTPTPPSDPPLSYNSEYDGRVMTYIISTEEDIRKFDRSDTNMKANLRNDTDEIINNFQKIITEFRTFLKNSSADTIEELDITRKSLMKKNSPVYENFIPRLDRDSTTTSKYLKILDFINNYCSFFSYDLLEFFFETEKCKVLLTEHKERVAKYAKRRLFYFPSGLGIKNASRVDVLVKLDDAYNQCTVSHLVHFHKRICELFKVRKWQIPVDGVMKGCICINFHLPEDMKFKVFPLSSDILDSLKIIRCNEAKVLHLSCDNFQYDIQELQGLHTSGEKNWIPTDIADHTQLGSPRRLDDKRTLMESFGTCSNGNVDDRMRRLQQQLEEMEIRAQESARRAEEEGSRVGQLQRELAVVSQSHQGKTREVQLARQQQREYEQHLQESTRGVTSARKQLRECEQHLQERTREVTSAREQLRECEQHLQECTREVTSAREQLRESEHRLTASTSHWIVRSEEVEMTGPELGRGGWATVSVATFRGVRVAAKTIHRQIISRHNVQLFRREMNMAARLRHPNLVQFIGATMEGNMVILTELMPTSLRAQLQHDIYMLPRVVMSVSLDVARALNYLHRMQPDPIIHHDISSANVLLEPLLVGQWRAKLSDYGTVNFFHQLETVNPGSPVYAAPEANDPCLQSTKMDIYSFGALMLEMLTGQLPTPEDRPAILLKVHHDQLLDLIHRCLSERAHDRPDAATVIGELTN